MLRGICCWLLLFCLKTSCSSAPKIDPNEGTIKVDRSAETVSIYQLLVNPEKFDGKHVRLIGFVTVGFEDYMVYPHQDDARFTILNNGIPLVLPHAAFVDKAVYQQYSALDYKYVIIEGTFSGKYYKNARAWDRRIRNITRFKLWGDPAAKPEAADPTAPR